MVNPILNANITASIGMPVVIGNNPAITPESNNFKELISNLFTTELSKENSQLALDASANDKIKSALYQAASILNLNGSIKNIASMDTSAIANDMLVSSIMQNNNLSNAERQVFLQALKVTSIEIVSNKAADINQPYAALSVAAPAPVTPAVLASRQALADTNTQIPSANTAYVTALVTSDKILTGDTNRIPTDLKVSGLAVVDASLKNNYENNAPFVASKLEIPQTVVSQPDIKPADDKTNITIAVVNTDKSKIAGQALDLAGQLDGILKSISISKSDAPQVVDKKTLEILSKIVGTVKIKIEDIQNNITPVIQDSANTTAIKEAITGVITDLNNLAAAVTAPVLLANQQPIAVSNDNSTETGSVTLNLKPANDQSDSQGTKYTITSSEQPQEFKSVVAKIVALLNELNGSLSVTNKPVYASRPDIALELAVNNPSFQQVKAALDVLTSIPQKTVVEAVVNNQTFETQPVNIQAVNNGPESNQAVNTQALNNQPSQITLNIAQSSFVQPKTVELKPQAEADTAANVKPAIKTADVITVDAVKTVVKPEFDKTGSSKQDAPSKNIISDVRWISDNIIKPAALGNEAAAMLGKDKQVLFDRVAEFAGSIKEQIVLKQVVSNINDSSNSSKVSEIKMVLKPENLGSVYIKLEHVDGEIKGSIMVTNDSVRESLKANLPELRVALNNIGINVGNLDISMANSNTGSSFQGQARNNFSQWQGAAQAFAAENIMENGVDSFVNADGYLNYLA